MFQFPDALSTADFLGRHWQKSCLFMPQALAAELPALSADELAWLATLDDVESRIVFLERSGDTVGYRVEHGPFDDKFLAALPREDWTLMVQDVEKHLPDFRSFIQAASFIPDWRIDDLMVSFAAPGGSVGPHRDNYDVFLCQGIGQREWRIARKNSDLKEIDSGELLLVEPFMDDSPVLANRGDVLYLPPGIAHWGIATESSMTYSIGMRAPTLSEFIAVVSRALDSVIDIDRADVIFYSDPDLSEHEAEAGLISDRAIERAREAFTSGVCLTEEDFACAFGSVVTDVKAWLAPEQPGRSEVDAFLAGGNTEVRVHGMARLAYCTVGRQDFVFLNGHAKSVSADQMAYFRRFCSYRVAQAKDDALVRWLLAHGAFDLQPDEQNDAT